MINSIINKVDNCAYVRITIFTVSYSVLSTNEKVTKHSKNFCDESIFALTFGTESFFVCN